MNHVTGDIGHWFYSDVMLPGLKQIYYDLGYVRTLDDFNEPASDLTRGTWEDFDQTEFVFDIDFYESGIGQSGKVFIPEQCYEKECRLHICFHACESNAGVMADRSQYAQLGATNDFITVFPNS